MKKLLLGVAVSAAMFGATAHAATVVTNVDATTGLGFNSANNTPAVTLAGNLATVVYLSGSSALNPVIEKALIEGSNEAVCASGKVVKYIDVGTSGSDQAAYYCQLNTNNPRVTAFMNANGGKPNMLLFKRNAGGSLMGVNGVIKAVKQEYLNLTTTNTTSVTVGSATGPGCVPSASTPSGFAKSYTCSYSANPANTTTGGNNTTTTPTFGVSDVTPNILTAAAENAPTGTAVFSTAGITVVPATAQTFGIAVTTSLRNALQEAQFGVGNACVGQDTAACMPNLNSTQVGQLLAAYPAASNGGNTITAAGQGKIAKWSQLKVGSSNLFDIATTKPANDTVHICGRTIGSGTKSVTGAVFLGNGCKATVNTMAQNFDWRGISESTQADYSATAQVESATRPTVHAMSSSGGLVECLDELNSGDQAKLGAGSFAPGTKYGADAASAKRWAIGYISLDRNDSDSSKGYKIIKIDGAVPTLTNVANGSYPFWMESVYLYKTTIATTVSGLVKELISSFGKPAVLTDINNAKSNYPWGLSGNMAVPSTTNVQNLDGSVNTSLPVNPMSYAIYPGTSTATATDDCRAPLLYSNTTAISGGSETGAINTNQNLILVP